MRIGMTGPLIRYPARSFALFFLILSATLIIRSDRSYAKGGLAIDAGNRHLVVPFPSPRGVSCYCTGGIIGRLAPNGNLFTPLNVKKKIRSLRKKLIKAGSRRAVSKQLRLIKKYKRTQKQCRSMSRQCPSLPEGSTLCIRIEQYGINWTFDQAYPCGQFANGDWWVVGPVNIVGINPGSKRYDSETEDGSSRIMHGTMVNPAFSSSQGFDSYMCKYPNGYNPAYEPGLNAALPNGRPVSENNPLSVATSSSVISTVSRTIADLRADATSSNKKTLKSAAVLTVLGAAPRPGSFRPAYANVSKEVRFNKSELDYSILKALPHVADMPRLHQAAGDSPGDSVERSFERIGLDLCSSSVCNWNALETFTLYGRDFSAAVAQAVLMLNLDYPNAEKETLFIRLVQLGIDQAGIFDAGGYWPSNGGIYSGRKLPILLAGLALRDEHMTAAGDWRIDVKYSADPIRITLPFQDDGQIFYVSETDPAAAFTNCESEVSPANINFGCGGYGGEHLGMPEYGIRHQQRPSSDSISKTAPYRGVNFMGYIPTAIALQVMELKRLWKHDSFFDYADRMWQVSCDDGNCGSFGNTRVSYFIENMWSTYRENYGCSYISLDSVSHTRRYRCEGAELQCSAIGNCAGYPNDRARQYDPCGLGCQ